MARELEGRGLIGRGAHGMVQLVYDRAQRRFFALKILEAAGDAGPLLVAERRWLSGEADPPVPIVEVFGEDGEAGLVSGLPPKAKGTGPRVGVLMSLVLGPTVRQLAEDPSFGRREAAALIALVAKRLVQIKEHGAHLDLKPENVMVDRSGRVFLIDAHTLVTKGTAPYAAPEQASGEPGPAADLWALGTMGLWLLAGRFPDGSKEVPELAPPPASWAAEERTAFDELTRLCKTMRKTDPAARGDPAAVATRATELAVGVAGADLAAVVAASYGRAKLPEWIGRVQEEMARTSSSPSPLPSPPKGARESSPRVFAGMVLGAGLVAAIVGFRVWPLLFSRHHPIDLTPPPAAVPSVAATPTPTSAAPPAPAPPKPCALGEILRHDIASFRCVGEKPAPHHGIVPIRALATGPGARIDEFNGHTDVWWAKPGIQPGSVALELAPGYYHWHQPAKAPGPAFIISAGRQEDELLIGGEPDYAPSIPPEWNIEAWNKVQKEEPARVVRLEPAPHAVAKPERLQDGPLTIVGLTWTEKAAMLVLNPDDEHPCDGAYLPLISKDITPGRPHKIEPGSALWACPKPHAQGELAVHLLGYRPK